MIDYFISLQGRYYETLQGKPNTEVTEKRGNQKIWLEVDKWNGGIVQDSMGKSTFIWLDIIIYLSLRISK